MIRFFLKISVLLLLFANHSYADNHRFVIFPFTDEKPATINSWAKYAVSELCFLKMHSLQEINVLEPLNLFLIDSTAYKMDNDSILERHQECWKWDVAVGGSFTVANDTLNLNVKVYWKTAKHENLKIEMRLADNTDNLESIAAALIFRILSAVKISITESDSAYIMKKNYDVPHAFKTCAQGMGFEMHGQNDAAVTAYSRAVELDHDCAYALCNLSNLYNKNGNFNAAMKGYSQVSGCKYRNNYTIAMAANFMVDKAVPSEALRFIDNQKSVLEKSADGMLAIGKGYLAQGEYHRATAILTQALAAGASDLEIQFTLGNAYLLSAEYQKAISMFNELVRFHPDNLRYYSSLGAAFRNSGSLMEAGMILESALRIDPDNVTILIDLAHTYFDLKWYQRSRQLLQKAIDIDPELEIAYVNLGVVYWFEGRKNDARKSFGRAAQVPLSKRASWNNLGNIFSIEGKNRKAIRAYRKADKAGKKNAVVQYNMAVSYMKSGRANKAIEHFNELLRLAPDRIDILLRVAELAGNEGHYSEALSYYRKILEIYPYHREAINNYVALLCKNGNVKDAVKPIELYLENFPTDKDMILLLCSVYYKMGWFEVAAMKYGSIIREFPDVNEGYRGIARCMYDMIIHKGAKNYDETIYALKQASEHSPADPEMDIHAGDLYLEYKHYKDLAIEHYERALAKTDSIKIKRMINDKIEKAREM